MAVKGSVNTVPNRFLFVGEYPCEKDSNVKRIIGNL